MFNSLNNMLHPLFRLVFILYTIFLCPAVAQSIGYRIVPLPQQIIMQRGAPFRLTADCRIVVDGDNHDLWRDARFLQDYIVETTGMEIAIGNAPSGRRIVLRLNARQSATEGYHLSVSRKEVLIEGKTPQGVFYGIQTLRKSLAGVLASEILLPAVDIVDAPRFSYRGMHLDVSRHFFDVDFIKQYLDMMALHNMNTFHWHLTDDQGWRLELKRYPLLTEKGAVRSYTTLGRNSSIDDGTPYSGYFTQQQVRDIVNYARDRFITIIPEIDMPGHMLAALAAYPSLGCTGGPYEVEGHWGVFDDILCAGRDETFTFVEGVLEEVMDLFPSPYIHIGGDEAPRTRWQACPRCQQRIIDEHLSAPSLLENQDVENLTPEARLQGYFTRRVERFVNSHGRHLIGWDELLESDVDSSATIMSWRGVDGGLVASERGHNVIMTPTSHCYFNFYYVEDHDYGEPFAFEEVIPIAKTYDFDPAPSTLSDAARRHILGVQGNLWTEYCVYPSQAEYQVLPRMGALAEVQWMQPAQKDFTDWVNRQHCLKVLYDHHGWHYATHIYSSFVQMK